MSDPTSSVFESSPQETPAAPAQQPNYSDLLGKIVNEQGQQKYATVEEALKGLQHAQSYIPELKGQLTSVEAAKAAAEAQLAATKTVEQSVQEALSTAAQSTPQGTTPETTTQGGTVDADTLAKIVSAQLAADKAQELAQVNETSVNEALINAYGDKATEVVAEKSAALGLSVEAVRTMSQQSPQAVLKLLGAEAPKPSTSSLTSSFSQSTGAPAPAELPKPEKSLLLGAKHSEQVAHLAKVREYVHQKYGVVTG